MIRDRLRGLLGRARPIGPGFDHTQDRAFARLAASAEGSFAQLNAAFVSSWEVLLTDVGRALAARMTEAEAHALTERASDSLVPTLSPVQGLGRSFDQAVKTGVKQALASGRLADATEPLGAALSGVGAEVAAGWQKTADYLAPLFAALPAPEAARLSFTAHGQVLADAFDEQARAAATALAGLPEQSNLEVPLLDAIDRYARATLRAVEVTVYAARTGLIEAV